MNTPLSSFNKSAPLAGILVLLLALVSAPTRTLGGQFNSVAAGGNWSVGATWSGGIAPANDTTTDWAYISGGGVVTNDATRSVGGLLTAGANLNINADLTIGNHDWFNSCSTFIGSGSSSSVMQAAGTTVTIGNNMKMSLGPDNGAVGDYTVGTNATLSVAGGLWIGDNTSFSLGSGSLTNNGGTINVGSFANGLLVGGGNLVINSGTLTVGTKLDLGLPSHTLTNNLIINGGTVTVSNQLVSGAHGQPGCITQNGGRLQVVNGALYCGGYGDGSGTGTFTQNGGTNTVATAVNFGGYGPNSGIYNLNGGRLVRQFWPIPAAGRPRLTSTAAPSFPQEIPQPFSKG